MRPTRESEAPHVTPPDRFTIRGKLGTGGAGVVYRAFDRGRQGDVALKTLRRSGASGDVFRFKREFRALADMAHPNLVTLYELHTSGDDWFFTMEVIEGEPFVRYVRPHEAAGDLIEPALDADAHTRETAAVPLGAMPSAVLRRRIVEATLDKDRLDAALYQLVDGVHALHVLGKLHRDLKPSNVLVEPSGRVVLLDFGLVADITGEFAERTHESTVGTPAYMSPEQAADVMLTEASDWYSVGVILYEALTGWRPFEGTAHEIMAAKRAADPRPPGELVAGIPEHLDRLCMALLSRDPAARPDGAAVFQILGRAPSPATINLASSATPFVGRDAELSALRAALADSRRGRGVAVFVRGPSGMGKSALVRHFLDEVTSSNPRAVVLEARCYQRESLPYKALDSVVDALTLLLARLPRDQLAAVLPRDMSALARLFPGLRRIPAIDTPAFPLLQPPDPVELRRRGFAALRVIFERLSAGRPVVISIDDLQWGDADSAAFLADLIHHPHPPPILFIAAHRSDDEGANPVLTVMRRGGRSEATLPGTVRDLTVGGLSDVEALDLLAELGHPSGDAGTVRALLRDCGGNPFFLAEMTRGGAAGEGHELGLDGVLQRHAARLPDDARALLELCAVAARPISVDLALRAAGLVREGSTVAILRAERLVRVRHVDEVQHIEPYHDRIREAVAAALGVPVRRGLHLALAEAIEQEAAPDHEALVGHWLEAGHPVRAGAHASLAAAAAEDALAFHRAADLYAFALAHGEPSADERRGMQTRMGHALAHAGRLDEAATAFAASIDGATAEEALDLRRLQVEQLLRGGRSEESMAAMDELLAAIGFRLPKSRGRLLAAVLGQEIRLKLRGEKLAAKPKVALTPAFDRRIHVLWSLASGLAFVNPVIGRLLQLRLYRDALDSGNKRYMGIGLTMIFGYTASGGLKTRERCEAMRTRATGLAAELGDPVIDGWVRAGSGFASYLLGRWREGKERLLEGQQILRDRCSGVRWQLDIVEIYLAATLWCLGETSELVRLVPQLVREAEERGDRLAVDRLRSWRSNATWLVLDCADEAEANINRSIPPRHPGEPFQVTYYYELLALGQIALYRGHGAGAYERVRAVWRELERSMLLRVEIIWIEAYSVRGRCALATAVDVASPEPLRHDAESCARAIERKRTPWGQPMAAMLRAAVAVQREQLDAARATLVSAADAFAAAEMSLWEAAARYRLGELVGGDEGRRMIDAAKAAMYNRAVVDPRSMVAMLAPGFDRRAALTRGGR